MSWGAGSVLRRTSEELERNTVFRSLAGELAPDVNARSFEDQALLLLLPNLLPAVQAYYAGKSAALHELIDAASIQILDAWLADEVRYWAGRWHALDPTRQGSLSSTRAALYALSLELRSRSVPAPIEFLIAQCAQAQAGSSLASRWFRHARRAVRSWLNVARRPAAAKALAHRSAGRSKE